MNRKLRLVQDRLGESLYDELSDQAKNSFFYRKYAMNGRRTNGQRRHQRHGPGVPRDGVKHYVQEYIVSVAKIILRHADFAEETIDEPVVA